MNVATDVLLCPVLDRLVAGVRVADAVVGDELVSVDRFRLVAHVRADEAVQVLSAAVRNDPQADLSAALDRLKEGKKKGDTILGRFENIKKLEARTNKSLPPHLLNEVEALDGAMTIDVTAVEE